MREAKKPLLTPILQSIKYTEKNNRINTFVKWGSKVAFWLLNSLSSKIKYLISQIEYLIGF